MNAKRERPGTGMGGSHNRKAGSAKRTKRRRSRYSRRITHRMLNS